MIETRPVSAEEVKVRDVMMVLGRVHIITRIEPYTHPVVTKGETWAIAYDDTGEGKPWGITLSPGGTYDVW